MNSPTSKRGKQAEIAASNSQGRAMLHAPGIISNMHGSQRPRYYVDSRITRAVTNWSSAYLPGYSIAELEDALRMIKQHPDQATVGYSKAKNTRQRLEMELNRQRAARP
jgi:hypothetical protein